MSTHEQSIGVKFSRLESMCESWIVARVSQNGKGLEAPHPASSFPSFVHFACTIWTLALHVWQFCGHKLTQHQSVLDSLQPNKFVESETGMVNF